MFVGIIKKGSSHFTNCRGHLVNSVLMWPLHPALSQCASYYFSIIWHLICEGHCSCVGMSVLSVTVGPSFISVETIWKSQLHMKSLTYESNKRHWNVCFSWYFWVQQYRKKKKYICVLNIWVLCLYRMNWKWIQIRLWSFSV